MGEVLSFADWAGGQSLVGVLRNEQRTPGMPFLNMMMENEPFMCLTENGPTYQRNKDKQVNKYKPELLVLQESCEDLLKADLSGTRLSPENSDSLLREWQAKVFIANPNQIYYMNNNVSPLKDGKFIDVLETKNYVGPHPLTGMLVFHIFDFARNCADGAILENAEKEENVVVDGNTHLPTGKVTVTDAEGGFADGKLLLTIGEIHQSCAQFRGNFLLLYPAFVRWLNTHGTQVCCTQLQRFRGVLDRSREGGRPNKGQSILLRQQ